jgi:hypothetical protein
LNFVSNKKWKERVDILKLKQNKKKKKSKNKNLFKENNEKKTKTSLLAIGRSKRAIGFRLIAPLVISPRIPSP